MTKTIHEMAKENAKYNTAPQCASYRNFVAGANAVIKSVNKELMRAYMNDFDEFSDHDRDIAQGVLGCVKIFLVQLKGK